MSRATDDLPIRFGYHPANSQWKAEGHQALREACLQLAEELNARLTEGREKALALTKIEEAMFWANAALARHGRDA